MATSLHIGLRVEGVSDDAFLRGLLPRLLPTPPGTAIAVSFTTFARAERDPERIADALCRSHEALQLDVACVHRDGDSRQAAGRGQDFVQEIHSIAHAACGFPRSRYVPVVPMRTTEAWVLADPVGLGRALGAERKVVDMIERFAAPEDILDPKATLAGLVREVRRRRRASLPFELVAAELDIDRLRRCRSFADFEADFVSACRQALS